MNLTQVVKRAGVNWDDFYVGERDVATVNGKVIGIPALVDNLAVVYNKTLFARRRPAPPAADWTWPQFVADAKKLTQQPRPSSTAPLTSPPAPRTRCGTGRRCYGRPAASLLTGGQQAGGV